MELAVVVFPTMGKNTLLELQHVGIRVEKVGEEGEPEVRRGVEHAVDHSVQQSGERGDERGRRAQRIRHRAFKMEIPVASREEDDGVVMWRWQRWHQAMLRRAAHKLVSDAALLM